MERMRRRRLALISRCFVVTARRAYTKARVVSSLESHIKRNFRGDGGDGGDEPHFFGVGGRTPTL